MRWKVFYLYISVPVSDVQFAAAWLTRCIADVTEWLSADWLLLDPIRTLSSLATVVDTARRLGVIVNCQLTMSAPVNAMCCLAYTIPTECLTCHPSAFG